MLRKFAQILLIAVIAMVAVVGFCWYRYAVNTQSPYDEVGIELNSRMPGPINTWACGKLHTTFGDVLPPYGCQDAADSRQWR